MQQGQPPSSALPAARQKLEFLDELRGVAILVVFLYHALLASYGMAHLPWRGLLPSFEAPRGFLALLPLTLGWSGVAIFFVISGFCIHLSFQRKPDWREFWGRRFFRVYPPYVAAVFFCALVTGLGWSSGALKVLFSHLLLIHNFHERTFFAINPSFWSIGVEVQLYLLYPVLLWAVARHGWRRVLIFLAALELGLRVAYVCVNQPGVFGPAWLVGVPFAYWFSWSVGAALADDYLHGRPPARVFSRPWQWAALAVAANFVKPLVHFSFPCVAMATAAVIAGLLRRPRETLAPGRLWPRLLAAAGLISYSLYLLHQPLLEFARRPETPPLVTFAIALAFLVPISALAALWYRAFELPSIEFGKNLIRRRG